MRWLTVGMATLVLAACSAGSGGKAHPTLTSSPLPDRLGIAPTPTSKAYAAQVRQRGKATIAYAEQLAARAPQLAGETPYTGPLPKDLRSPDETIGASNLVVRARYWKAPGSADHVYRQLKRATPPSLRLTGYGVPSSPAEDVAGRGFVHFDPTGFPSYIEGGELYIEMQSLGRRQSVIAAFAEVYSHPVRMASEYISPTGASGTARWPRFRLDPNGGFATVVAHPQETLTPAQVAGVVNGFNRSPVANAPDVCMGALRTAGDEVAVTITSGRHTWVLTYPGTSCVDLSVTRDGVSYPALQVIPALRTLLDVLKHADGNVAGHLYAVGGPAGAQPIPLEGTVTLTVNGKPATKVHTRGHGYFLLPAPPGTYRVTATSRQFSVDGRPGTCMANGPVTVTTDTTSHIDVYCQRR